ncbi:MAG TPA: 4-(cytidine 5'-diphospho)-2-C-methyl-D-erythritol kinase [Steroidobacteraceae bacterium]|nr:4-(cytidine 5'-diphospho)-2-C-methyl-D-erythritol kinase [Steroidobacteraceae bacterium]
MSEPMPAGALTWWPAPAKLNLFLQVTGRAADGYHELQTLFQLIDHCDRIGVVLREDGRIERHAGLAGVAPEQDLAVRAALLLQRHCGVALGADLHVVKRIPAGGGLGGGSSDAATVLLALNHLWRTGLAVADLAQLGLALGADVPVFVHGSSAWGEGRGERLEPMELPPRWFLVIHPGVAVSTAEVFQAPELTRNSPVITIRAFAAVRVGNACEPVVRSRYPEVAEALDWLAGQIDGPGEGARARMTGTGSCIFASFERAADAERIAARVPDPWRSFVARGLNRSPVHALL